MNKNRKKLEVEDSDGNFGSDFNEEDEEILNPKKKKKVAKRLSNVSENRFGNYNKVVEFYRETDTSEVKQTSKIWSGFEFHIINDDDKLASKPYLEKMIV